MKKNFKLFIVTIMTLLLLSVSAFAKTDFPDVPRNNTELSKAIYTLADAGIVGGYEDGCFRPNNYLTRAELCKMVNLVFKYTEKDITNFPDVKVGDWFYDYVLVAKKAGYIKGFEDGTFRGGENLTREQTCIIISRTAGLFNLPTSTVVKDEISFWAKSDVMKVIANFVMPVDANSNFRAKENITRGELAMALDAFVKDTTPPSKPSTPSTPSIPPSPSVPTITTYTVKFYDGNGVVISTQTVEKGKGATAPTTPPTKTADKEYTYTFSQWDKVFTSITSNLSVYPVFDKKDKLYTVNLNYGDGTTGNTPESITMAYNQYFSQVLPAANSFSNGTNYFAGWYSGDTLIDDEKYSDLEPLTLTARWVSTFTVNFYNGDGSIMKTETVKFGKNATAPTTKPSKADDNEYTYTYIGWDKTFTNVTSNLDVHASFNKSDRLYKVNLTYGTGATGTKPPSVSIKYNQPFSEVLPQSGFSNGTKYFAGWYSGDVLVSGQRYSDLKPTTLTAKWVSTFTVNFYDSNGFILKTETVKHSENATPPAAPAKPATNEYTYSFTGWSESYMGVTKNLDIYPKYDEEDRLYTVTLNYGTGTTGAMPETIMVTYNALLSGALPQSGFSNGTNYFAGWYSGTTLIGSQKYSDLKPTTLTAKWVSTFTVNFYDSKGFVLKTETVKHSDNATPPADPAKPATNEYTYSFTGWSESYMGVTKNLDIYPEYKETAILYTVNLDYGSGTSGTMPQSVLMTYNQSFSSVLPQSGFTNGSKNFAGWYVGDTLVDSQKYSDLTPTTLTAKWVSTFTVTFYNGDGSIMKTETVKYGKSATAPAKKPTRASSEAYEYTFTDWDKSFTNVTRNLAIYPIFSRSDRYYTVYLNYSERTEGNMPASVKVPYNGNLSEYLPINGFTNLELIFTGWYSGSTLIENQKYSELKPSSLTTGWSADPTVVAENKPLLDELDVVLREINAPLADGFTSDQLYALEPVQTAIELTMADGNMGYRVSKQYILDYYRTYVNEAIRRTKANGFDKEAFKFALGNNLSSYTVDFLLDFFDVDIEDYV